MTHDRTQFLQHDEVNETQRIELFSDAVFAIAMTLLVTEIDVPTREDVAEHSLVSALLARWPSYLAFLTSFLTILVIWIHHHWMYGLIRRSDQPLLYWNGLLLLVVTFVPFPTALVAEFLNHPDAKVAASLYTGTLFAISLALHAVWRHASTNLLDDSTDTSGKEAARLSAHYRFGPIAYFGTFVSSFFSEVASLSLALALAGFFAFRGSTPRR